MDFFDFASQNLYKFLLSPQVLEFFNGYGVTGRVHLKQDFSRRPSGEVFVEFASNDEAGCAWDCGRFKVQFGDILGIMNHFDSITTVYYL